MPALEEFDLFLLQDDALRIYSPIPFKIYEKRNKTLWLEIQQKGKIYEDILIQHFSHCENDKHFMKKGKIGELKYMVWWDKNDIRIRFDDDNNTYVYNAVSPFSDIWGITELERKNIFREEMLKILENEKDPQKRMILLDIIKN